MAMTLIGFLVKHAGHSLVTSTEYVPNPGQVYGGPVLIVSCQDDRENFSGQIYNVNNPEVNAMTALPPLRTFAPAVLDEIGRRYPGQVVNESQVQEIERDLIGPGMPAWNCLSDPTFPGHLGGPHYCPRAGEPCEWCGKSSADIADEYADAESER